MTPNVEQTQVCSVAQELVCQLHQLRIVVMAGSLPAERVFRQIELLCGFNAAAVQQALITHRLHNAIIAIPKGISHTYHLLSKAFFEVLFILAQLLGQLFITERIQARMGQRMHRHLVSAIELRQNFRIHAPNPNVLVLPDIFAGLNAGIEVKGSLHAVQVKQLNQTHVLGNTVVVRKGKNACFSAWKRQHFIFPPSQQE